MPLAYPLGASPRSDQMRFGTSDTPTVAMIRSVNVGVTSAIDNGVSAPGAGRHTGSVRRLRACGIFLLQRGQIPRSDIVVTMRLSHDRDVHVMAMGLDAVIPPPNPGLNDAADDLCIRDQVENARVTGCHQRFRELTRIDAVRRIMRDVHRTHDAVRVWVMFGFRGLMALVADRAVA